MYLLTVQLSHEWDWKLQLIGKKGQVQYTALWDTVFHALCTGCIEVSEKVHNMHGIVGVLCYSKYSLIKKSAVGPEKQRKKTAHRPRSIMCQSKSHLTVMNWFKSGNYRWCFTTGSSRALARQTQTPSSREANDDKQNQITTLPWIRPVTFSWLTHLHHASISQ